MSKPQDRAIGVTLEKSIADTIKKMSETSGPSTSRIIENAVENYLKDKQISGQIIHEEKTTMHFYPDMKIKEKLQIVAQAEGRSVSNLVARIVKQFIENDHGTV
jgi:metal-responsive CopG/Arc/MetJ family transcriptional regulator